MISFIIAARRSRRSSFRDIWIRETAAIRVLSCSGGHDIWSRDLPLAEPTTRSTLAAHVGHGPLLS